MTPTIEQILSAAYADDRSPEPTSLGALHDQISVLLLDYIPGCPVVVRFEAADGSKRIAPLTGVAYDENLGAIVLACTEDPEDAP